MSLRDIGFWIRAAKADRKLASLCRTSDTSHAFDQLYRAIPDPYGTTLPYYRCQRLKYERILAMLPEKRFQRVLDVGCGLGVMTRMLANRAEQVIGVDVAESALDQARVLSARHANICYEAGDVRHLDNALEKESFDLIVIADVLYYLPLTEPLLKSIRSSVKALLAPDGLLLLTHHSFFGFDMASRQTRRIHDYFVCGVELEVIRERWHPFYLTSVLCRNNSNNLCPKDGPDHMEPACKYETTVEKKHQSR